MAIARVVAVLLATLSVAGAQTVRDPENTLFLYLKDGRVVIEMRPDLAPAHVARIKELVRQRFYDGIVFHRVIEGFMAQTGDPTGTGTGGSGRRLPAEFTREPDGFLGFLALGLTMGQWLSVPMVVAGIALMAWAYRRPA